MPIGFGNVEGKFVPIVEFGHGDIAFALVHAHAPSKAIGLGLHAVPKGAIGPRNDFPKTPAEFKAGITFENLESLEVFQAQLERLARQFRDRSENPPLSKRKNVINTTDLPKMDHVVREIEPGQRFRLCGVDRCGNPGAKEVSITGFKIELCEPHYVEATEGKHKAASMGGWE